MDYTERPLGERKRQSYVFLDVKYTVNNRAYHCLSKIAVCRAVREDHTIHVICTKIKEEVPIPEEPITPEEPTKSQEKTPTQQEQKREVPKTGLHNSPTPYIIGGVVVLIVAGIIIVFIRKNHNE